MKMNVYALSSVFWYTQFRFALENRQSEIAEQNFKRYQYWKRRAKVCDMLEEICEQKENRHAH